MLLADGCGIRLVVNCRYPTGARWIVIEKPWEGRRVWGYDAIEGGAASVGTIPTHTVTLSKLDGIVNRDAH